MFWYIWFWEAYEDESDPDKKAEMALTWDPPS